LYPATQRIRRLKHFSDTRWTYHDRSIDPIYLTYGAILKALQKIINQKCNEIDVKSKTLAKGLLKSLNSFEFVVIKHNMMRQFFSCTSSLSNYLQSPKSDLIGAIRLVNAIKNELSCLISMEKDKLSKCLFNECNLFCLKYELDEETRKSKRTSLKKNEWRTSKG